MPINLCGSTCLQQSSVLPHSTQHHMQSCLRACIAGPEGFWHASYRASSCPRCTALVAPCLIALRAYPGGQPHPYGGAGGSRAPAESGASNLPCWKGCLNMPAPEPAHASLHCRPEGQSPCTGTLALKSLPCIATLVLNPSQCPPLLAMLCLPGEGIVTQGYHTA